MTINEISDAIVERLSEYGAELSYAPDFNLKKMQRKKIVVCPVGRKKTIVSRGSDEELFSIEIAIVHKCREDSSVSELLELSERIGESVLRTSIEGCTCVKVEWQPMYSVDSLRDNGVFISVIGALFKEIA